MYASYFGLRCQPFEHRADPQFFFATSEGEETLASLEYEVRHGKGAAMLLGEAGTGKTLMVRTIVARFDATDQVVVVTVPTSGEIDILRESCKSFGVTLPSKSASSRYMARLRRHLVRSNQAGHNSILILDQAESLREDDLALLANLADLQNDGTRLLSILLVAQPRFLDVLNNGRFARFRQHLFGERTIAPMTVEETRSYIQHRLEVAGALDPKLFDDAAVDTIHQASGGIARLINHLCNAALLSAYGGDEKRVSQAIAKEVTRTKSDTDTNAGKVAERTAPAREVGVQGASAVASGLTAPPPSQQGEPPAARPTSVTDMTDDPFPVSKPDWHPDGGPSSYLGFRGGMGFETPMGSAGAGIATENATEQLERVTLRADRAQATMEASLVQQATVEKHLTSLVARAEHFMQGLAGTMQQATTFFDTLQGKVAHVLEEAEARADALEDKAVRVQDWSEGATEQAVRIEQACDRADSIENRLTSFAEEFSQQADSVHDGVAQLMTGIDSGNEARRALQIATEQASETHSKMQAAGEKDLNRLQELVEQGDAVCQRFSEETLSSCREKLVADAKAQAETQVGLNKIIQSRLEQAQVGAADAVREVEQATRLVGTRIEEFRVDNEKTLAKKADALFEHMDKKLDRVAEECRHTLSKDTARLHREMEEMVEQAEIAKRKITDSVEDSLRQSMSGVQSELESLRVQAEALQADVGASLASATGKFQLVIDEQQTAGDKLADTLQHRFSDMERIVDSSITTAQQKTKQVIDEQRRAGDVLADTMQHRLEDMERFVDSSITNAQDKAKQILDEQRHVGDELAGVMQHRVEDLEQSIDAIDSRGTRLQDSFDKLSENIADSSACVTQLSGDLQQSGEMVGELSSRACAIQDDFETAVQRGEALGAKTAERIGQVEELQRSVSATLLDLGGAFERIQGFRNVTNEGEKIAGRLSNVVEAAGGVERRLSDSTKAAKAAEDELQQTSAGVAEQMSRMDSHHAAASQTLGRLSEANVTGHQLLSRVEKESKTLATSVEESRCKIDSITKEVRALTAKTEKQVNELRGRDGKVAEVVKQLDALIKPGEILVSQLTRRLDAANRHSKNLTKGCEEAGQLVERIASVSKILTAAKELAAGVEKTVVDAQTVHADLTEHTEQAEQVATKLAGLSAEVNGQLEAQSQLQQESDQTSEQIAGYLSAAGETMDSGRQQLKDMTALVHTMSAKVETLTGNVAQAKEAIEIGTAESKRVIQAGQNQAQQLEQVCAAVRKVFSALSKATLEARQKTETITKTSQAASQQVTNTSQAASQQITKTCQAAAQQINTQCQAAGQQITKLTAHSDRASSHLQEWVREAVLAQTRLDQTLQRTPSIRETHSSGSLQNAILPDVPVNAIEAQAVPATDFISVAPAVVATPAVEPAVLSPAVNQPMPKKSKSAEIAALISNAKRAVATKVAPRK